MRGRTRPPRPDEVGSAEHKERFCRHFIATHCRFDPAALAWPDLDPAELERLRAVPFWQEVLYTERRAGAIVAAYAQTIADPLVREASPCRASRRSGTPGCCG